MNISEMMLLFQLQQAKSAWRIGDVNGSDSNDTNDMQLFSSLLQAALQTNKSINPSPPINSSTGDQNKVDISGNNFSRSEGKQSLNEIIGAMGQKYGVDPKLIKEVVNAESGFDSHAVSPVGAEGLMQLMPGTASSYGVKDPLDSVQNLDGGTHFLKDLLNRFQGNIPLALAAYNAGPGAVENYDGIPPYAETQAYVKKIMAGLNGIDQKV
ncbi:MAG: lytic transglycosylase domain-containing protein [Desulfitobacteriaceae bacterium]